MHIAIAVDGSQFANSALEMAQCLPFKIAKASIISVLPPHDNQDPKFKAARGMLEAETEKLLKSSKRRFEKRAKVSAETHILTGNPVSSIAAFANNNKVDLLIMGSRGLNPIKDFLLGGVSHGVIQNTECSVLLAKAPFSADEKDGHLEIVLGYDDGAAAKNMITMFLDSDLEKAKSIDLVSCDEMVLYYGIGLSAASMGQWAEHEDYMEKKLKDVASEFTKKHKQLKVRSEVLWRVLDVASALNTYAEDRKKDLIAVSSSHKGMVGKIMFGSVSNRLAHHGNKAVLVIR